MTDRSEQRARLVGINHVALMVDDIEEALDFYGSLFEFDLRGRTDGGAFVDMGDQFIALMEGSDDGEPDDHRHFGLVVDDPETVRRRLQSEGIGTLPTSGLDFRDPWGNRIQIVGYEEIQFSKREDVLRAMGLSHLEKTEAAIAELAEKGMAPVGDSEDPNGSDI